MVDDNRIPYDLEKIAKEHREKIEKESNRNRELPNNDDLAESDTTEIETTNSNKINIKLLISLAVIIVFLLVRFAHPSKPNFIIQDATVLAFNISMAALPPSILLTSTLQITVAVKNPTLYCGIFYDDMRIYAEYKNQPITYQTDIPNSYQRHAGDTNVWSLFVNATNVPIAPYNVPCILQDQLNGIINLKVKLEGRIRWKFLFFITHKYHIHVLCNAMMDFGQGQFGNNGFNGGFVFASVKYLLGRRCSVSIV